MVSIIHSFNCCFTAVDFDEALIEIDAIIRDIDKLNELPSEAKTRRLEEAFSLARRCLTETSRSKQDKQLSFLLADTLWKYGLICREENDFVAKQIFLASLSLHFHAIGITSTCIDMREFVTLQDLKKQANCKPSLLASAQHLAATTDPNHIVAAAWKNKSFQTYPERRLISLAQTLRCLGHCCQNLDAYKEINEQNDRWFNTLFQASESLLLLADTDSSKHELADLYFEAWPFMHQRQHPQDTEGLYNLCSKALSYDSSTEMKVRVANKQFLVLFSSNKEDEALKLIQKAISLSETLEENEKNRFLINNLYYNLSCVLLTPGNFDDAQAEMFLTRAKNYADECRQRGRDHIFFAIYDMRFAEYKLAKGELEEAKASVESALQTLKKYPHSQQPHIFKAQALHAYTHRE